MIPDLDPIEWAALGCGAALVELVGAYCLVAPWLSRINGNRFDNERPKVNPADERRWAEYERTRQANPGKPGVLPPAATPAPARRGVGETLARAAHWLAVKATRSDRTEADR